MKTLNQLLAFFIVILLPTSNVLALDREIDVGTFTKISLRISVSVHLTQGNIQKVKMVGKQKDLDEIEIKVKHGKLIIDDKHKNNWKWRLGKVDVYVTVKDLEAISVAGSGDLMSKGKFKCDNLDISVAGSGDVEFEVDARDVDISIAGSGNILLSGSSDTNKVSIAGSGKLDAEGMATNNYRISIAGSGKCKVHAKEEITSKITGSGSVYYKGEPQKIHTNSLGSGKVKRI